MRIAILGLLYTLAAIALTACSTPERTEGARVRHVTVHSRLIGGRMPMALVAPSGAGRGRGLVVFLHGRGANQDSYIDDQLLAALHKLGRQAPDLAFPYGGDHSYWHDRADGAWRSYVLEEMIPAALHALHADPRRIAIGGISMGGFGAYDIARHAPGRFCAVGGHSAALWASAPATAPGSFDDAGDFARNDVIAFVAARPHPYGHARLWLDGGGQDPFHAADELFAHELQIPMHVWPGGHDLGYWNAHWRDYLSFYAGALASCR